MEGHGFNMEEQTSFKTNLQSLFQAFGENLIRLSKRNTTEHEKMTSAHKCNMFQNSLYKNII